jgi:hypothetical protein
MDNGQQSDQQRAQRPENERSGGSDGESHQFVDRSKIDFDPEDGLYTGTAVEGTSEIPGPHEQDDSDGATAEPNQDDPPADDDR